MHINIVRDGYVEADRSISFDESVRDAILGRVVAPEQEANYRFVGAYYCFSSADFENERFEIPQPRPTTTVTAEKSTQVMMMPAAAPLVKATAPKSRSAMKAPKSSSSVMKAKTPKSSSVMKAQKTPKSSSVMKAKKKPKGAPKSSSVMKAKTPKSATKAMKAMK